MHFLRNGIFYVMQEVYRKLEQSEGNVSAQSVFMFAYIYLRFICLRTITIFFEFRCNKAKNPIFAT